MAGHQNSCCKTSHTSKTRIKKNVTLEILFPERWGEIERVVI